MLNGTFVPNDPGLRSLPEFLLRDRVVSPSGNPSCVSQTIGGDESATAVILLSSADGLTSIDGSFSFIATAPLTTGATSLHTARVHEQPFRKSVVRSGAHGRKSD
jgi:hypothetical protein